MKVNLKNVVLFIIIIVCIATLKSCCRILELPKVQTTPVTGITQTSAISGGNVTDNGGAEVTSRGVCWNVDRNPDINSNKTSDGAGNGSFTSSINGLTANTNYFVRAYATNSEGTAYGNEVSFPTKTIELASLTTNTTIALNENVAISGGNITSDGGSPITARGVCWSSTPYPTISDSHTIDGNGIGNFTSDLRCLLDETTYYARAYATNGAGIAYGNQQNFITKKDPITFNPTKIYGMVSDIDGNCYKTIQVGGHTWMAENLKTSRYNDGTSIPNIEDDNLWSLLAERVEMTCHTSGAFCWYNIDSASYESDYGKLYNFGAVETGKLCPVGWRVPIFTEWRNDIGSLAAYPYNPDSVGGIYREIGTFHWNRPYGTNETGFTALPGGKRSYDGSFADLGDKAYYWTPESGCGYGLLANYHLIPYMPVTGGPITIMISMKDGLSVRCVKD